MPENAAPVASVAAGWRHSLCVDTDGAVYSFGWVCHRLFSMALAVTLLPLISTDAIVASQRSSGAYSSQLSPAREHDHGCSFQPMEAVKLSYDGVPTLLSVCRRNTDNAATAISGEPSQACQTVPCQRACGQVIRHWAGLHALPQAVLQS